jgi:hypothetical protein
MCFQCIFHCTIRHITFLKIFENWVFQNFFLKIYRSQTDQDNSFNFRFQIGNGRQSKRLLANLGRILIFHYLIEMCFQCIFHCTIRHITFLKIPKGYSLTDRRR